MGKTNSNSPVLFSRESCLLLSMAAVFLVFGNGRWSIAVAAWLAPVFVLRFLRKQSPFKGSLIAYLVLVVTFFIYSKGMIPIPYVSFYILVCLSFGLCLLIPYLLDRLLYSKFPGFLATLVFPVSWVTMEFTNAKLNPYGDWGMIAYTQHGNLPLLQLLSVTGIWGVTFLMAWFASTVNWIWENGFEWEKCRKGAALNVGILLTVLLFGGARLVVFPPEAKTVRIASVSSPVPRASISNLTEAEKAAKVLSDQDIHDELFRLSKLGVDAGAKWVVWAEANAQVEKAREGALIERGKAFARQEKVYLTMGLFTAVPDQYRRENKATTFDPNGDLVADYLKSRPPPGEPSVIGDGIIPVINTPYGTVSSVICSDTDSPFHLRKQSLKAGIDILLVPSWDWREIDPYHTWMTAFRGIENGFSVVRQANDGLSQATDYQGNILASMDHYTTEERLMISQVPTAGTTTIYSRIGDLFAWLCLVALSLMIVKAARGRIVK